MPFACRKSRDRLGVELGQRALELAQAARPVGAVLEAPRLLQARAQRDLDLGRIGIAGGRPVAQRAVPVGLQSATSMPSIDVPLIRPSARLSLPIEPFLCMFPATASPAWRQSERNVITRVMANLKSDFLKILTERGFVHQCSDEAGLDALGREGRGHRPTSATTAPRPSLHVGSLISIMMLHWLQKCGGKPIVLMGGGTTRVGDPSGKDETRKILYARGDRGQQGRHGAGLRQVPQIRRGQDRRRDGRQRRVAAPSQLHRLPARRRAATSPSTAC